MGMVSVARLAAKVPGELVVMMTSGLRRTNSAARFARRSSCPSAHRYSMAMFSPSTLPIVQFAAMNRLPTMYPYRQYVDAGGLMAYAPSDIDMIRRAAVYVDKILKGAKPADLPVEEPVKYELVINVKAAKAIGLEVPVQLQQLADEMIE